jgi:NAD(P)-dependent dehydrogenase (short-subunit alcohol dehydrogenase family)
MQIQNQVFLVAGGGSGLGAATARMLALAGGKVVVADVNAAAEGVARSLGANARFHRTDVTDELQTQAAVDLCVSAFGAIHGVVNCAGIAPGERVVGKTGPHSLASFERAIRINLVGSFNVIRLAATKMSAQPAFASGERGVIVNTSSVASMDGQIGQAAYAASKGAVASLTLPAARDLARQGIRVCTIAPGLFDTPLLAALPEPAREALGQTIPFPPRLGVPGEYAALACHIAENQMLNGETIRLDGALRMAPK